MMFWATVGKVSTAVFAVMMVKALVRRGVERKFFFMRPIKCAVLLGATGIVAYSAFNYMNPRPNYWHHHYHGHHGAEWHNQC